MKPRKVYSSIPWNKPAGNYGILPRKQQNNGTQYFWRLERAWKVGLKYCFGRNVNITFTSIERTLKKSCTHFFFNQILFGFTKLFMSYPFEPMFFFFCKFRVVKTIAWSQNPCSAYICIHTHLYVHIQLIAVRWLIIFPIVSLYSKEIDEFKMLKCFFFYALTSFQSYIYSCDKHHVSELSKNIF